MKAYWIRTEGGRTVFELRDTAVPVPGPGQILVRVRAALLCLVTRDGHLVSRHAFPHREVLDGGMSKRLPERLHRTLVIPGPPRPSAIIVPGGEVQVTYTNQNKRKA